MTVQLTIKGDPDLVALAQIRNDGFRADLTGGQLSLSAGIIALGADNQARIVEAVRAFGDFDKDDEFDAHDIGDLEVELSEPGIATWRELIFFRVDEITPPGADAPMPALTIMLASEW